MNEATLHGLRNVKEVITKHESIVHIPITEGLLITYRKSYRAYKEALDTTKEQHKQEASVSKRKEQLEDLENRLNVKKQELEEKYQQAEKLIKERTDRLSVAVENGKLEDVIPAQAFLEIGNWKQNVTRQSRSKIEEINNKLSGCMEDNFSQTKVILKIEIFHDL